MKTMGNRLVVLFIGMAALWQFEISRPGSRRRSEGARSDNPERGDVPG